MPLPYRLVCFDMDSTLVRDEMLVMIGELAGRCSQLKEFTNIAMMNGDVDFAENFSQRVALLKGVSGEVLERAKRSMRLTLGAEEVCARLRKENMTLAVIGGISYFAEELAEDLGARYCMSNVLEADSRGNLTGRVGSVPLGSDRKRSVMAGICKEMGISEQQCVAVGDGANDIAMVRAAGLGIGFNAKPILRPYLDQNIEGHSLLPLLSILGL